MVVPQFLDIEGAFNFRDVGGRASVDGGVLRTGRLFRSAALDSLTDDGHGQLERLGIATVVDLRSHAEIERSGRYEPRVSGIEWVHVPSPFGPPGAGSAAAEQRTQLRELMAHDDPMSVMYKRIVTDGAPMLASALQLIAGNERRPLVFHCMSGKDRTGLVAFLAQVIAGVYPDDALDDFEASALAAEEVQADMRLRYPEVAQFADKAERMAGADRRWVVGAIEAVGGFEHLESWLDAIGVDSSVRSGVRRHLSGDG